MANGDPGPIDFSKYKKYNSDILGGPSGLASQKPNQPYIVDLVTLQVLYFQGLPMDGDLKVKSEINFEVVASPGRNVPLYQYTGGEDVITLTLTFYADEAGKEDVIRKCNWLRSLSRNNGYEEDIHPVQLVFGRLFKKSKYIIYACEVHYGSFDRPLGMLPSFASVDLELRKISTTNPSRSSYTEIDS